MNKNKITILASINAPIEKVWDYYTQPIHIVNWNFADPGWHCPKAENDMRIGGSYKARMEAKDGSFGFDFEAVYTEITEGKHFTYEFGNRLATVQFNDALGKTEVIVTFDPESENPVEMQKTGWQAILDNFKKYTESTQNV
ncbi:MAG: SRPBCC family protein [Bacteroidetes bacterium]|nr:SRPBCC family protein [Bacteroidota bacterium]